MKEFNVYDNRGVLVNTIKARDVDAAIQQSKEDGVIAPMVRLADWQQHEFSVFRQERRAERYARHAISDTVH